ncbi:hypothetical protein CUTA107171_19875 [Cupriavidus taiwanensis]
MVQGQKVKDGVAADQQQPRARRVQPLAARRQQALARQAKRAQHGADQRKAQRQQGERGGVVERQPGGDGAAAPQQHEQRRGPEGSGCGARGERVARGVEARRAVFVVGHGLSSVVSLAGSGNAHRHAATARRQRARACGCRARGHTDAGLPETRRAGARARQPRGGGGCAPPENGGGGATDVNAGWRRGHGNARPGGAAMTGRWRSAVMVEIGGLEERSTGVDQRGVAMLCPHSARVNEILLRPAPAVTPGPAAPGHSRPRPSATAWRRPAWCPG